jgi:SAM-dependent methyltransferase
VDAPGLVSSWSDQELAQLAATVRGGTPWRQALHGVTPPAAPGERIHHRADDARGNWLWLVDLTRWERALDVQGGIGTMTAALARHFTSVQYLDAARPALEFARARFSEDGSANVTCAQAGAGALPYRNATFDCVVWDGALGRGVSGVATAETPAVLAAVLAEGRRVLRPGGCLYVGIATAPVPGHVFPAGRILSALVHMVVRVIRVLPLWTWRRWATMQVRRVERLAVARALPRQLRAAGFARVEAYYVAPSFQEPWSIVPARRRAVLAFERLQMTHATHRRWLAWLSLHPVLFECHVFLAYT